MIILIILIIFVLILSFEGRKRIKANKKLELIIEKLDLKMDEIESEIK